MKCFYQELDRRKKYLITKLNNEIASLEWQWFQKEITDKEYVLKILSLSFPLILERLIRQLIHTSLDIWNIKKLAYG